MTAYFDIQQRAHPTRQGDIGLPIFYYNTAAIFANFLIDPVRAQALLPAELEPVQMMPGRGIATVAFFQYVDSSVGPYNEMGLAIAARPAASCGFRDTAAWHPAQAVLPGMYVAELPVTTETANAAGRDIWGYPKIVVPIGFQLRDSDIDCDVRDTDGSTLCRLQGRAGRGLVLAAPNLMTYTQRDGQLLRTVINLRGKMRYASAGSLRLSCGNGDHHLSRHLHDLGLDGQTPLVVLSGQGLQALLPEGQVVR